MKAIIVAAGPGSRLRQYTRHTPKCLLDIGGKTILQRAIEAMKENGIEHIAVVRGYLSSQITYPGLSYYENPDFESTNILRSLFCAESEMDDEFVFSYSDILYSADIVASLISSTADIALIVDVGWRQRYQGRDQHPVSEAELTRVDNGRVVAIGKGVVEPGEAHGEFIGLAKFTRAGAEAMKAAYHRASSRGPAARFQRAASMRQAYLTDMLQELVDTGHSVEAVDIESGWLEIDTPQDLAEARRSSAAATQGR